MPPCCWLVAHQEFSRRWLCAMFGIVIYIYFLTICLWVRCMFILYVFGFLIDCYGFMWPSGSMHMVSYVVKKQTSFTEVLLCLTLQAARFIHIKQDVYLHAWLWLFQSQWIQQICSVQIHFKRHGEQLSNSVAFHHHPQMQQCVRSHWLVPAH